MRLGLAIVLLLAWAAPIAAEAQPAGKIVRVGYLSSGTSAAGAGVTKAFTDGLRDHGWIEGTNIAVAATSAARRSQRRRITRCAVGKLLGGHDVQVGSENSSDVAEQLLTRDDDSAPEERVPVEVLDVDADAREAREQAASYVGS
jgi:hypothetical protein